MVALFVINPSWELSKYSSTVECFNNKLWYMHTMECIENKKLQPHIIIWINLVNIILNSRSQTQSVHTVGSHLYKVANRTNP